MIVNGHTFLKGDGSKVVVDTKKGYSFCNCRNIFFTNWSNMDQGSYDADYVNKYDNPIILKHLKEYIDAYGNVIKKELNGKFYGKALEIGCIATPILDGLSDIGMKTYGLDIVEHNIEPHQFICGDFENFVKELDNGLGCFSLIWASHVFEHFRNPVLAVKKVKDLLLSGGLFFCAMPDPYFIDWKNPYQWGHWHLKEHHVLWDMDSFVEVLEENGFEIIFAKHNVGYDFVCIGDFHIMARKK